jgi:hypothetical protein
MKYQAVKQSSNRKTGPIPVTYSQRETCPPSCPHYLDDCYAEGFHTRMTWDKIPARGVELAALLRFIESMPAGQIWRHNVAGDLNGHGEELDAAELGQIVAANTGRKGFTYTHKKSPDAIKWARHATEWGFTINLSADDAGEADELAAHGLPVVCIVPADTPKHTTTPAGRPILVCPAQTVDYMTCALCGQCQKADRRQIIGFRAHGTKARETDRKARRVIPIYQGVTQ